MNVDVKLFAVARQLVGTAVVTIEVPDDATIAQLRTALGEKCPQMAEMLRHLAFSVDADYATDDAIIPPDSEVACIPPVSGG